MIDPAKLLADLRRLLPDLEGDLRARASEDGEVDRLLRAQHQSERDAGRTADAFEIWRDAWVTQVAVAWLLSLVFVRYLEDNELVPARLAGSGERAGQADEHRQLYIRANPTHSDARYLQHVVFEEVGGLPAAEGLFGAHNLARALAPSGDMATTLLGWFGRQAAGGGLEHDFGGMRGDTRFLGDLYQDLSEDARKRYALLQTPEFVEEFILDHTMEPALEEFGLEGFRLIDPTCGSGHFLLGAFARLLDRWQAASPGVPAEDLVQRALDSVWGVDLNPFAVAIARFRLLLAGLDACGATNLEGAPAFRLNVTVADSLLAAPVQAHFMAELGDPMFSAEDPEAVRRTFAQRYHSVVGNPPYITVKDKALNENYRARFPKSCYRQYSLGVPFTEQFFALAVSGGFAGLIAANSFMKREFGKNIIQKVLPEFDLTHVVDTSGAYIPGHGTPTVILFGRNRRRTAPTLRAVLGIRGEPSTPEDPAQGSVWRSIADHVADIGFENEYISVVQAPAMRYRTHPWSLQGGGAASVKESLDRSASSRLESIASTVGFMVITGEDNCLLAPASLPVRFQLPSRPLGDGVVARDWSVQTSEICLWPNDSSGNRLGESELGQYLRYLWPYRRALRNRKAFGTPIEERGIPWWAIREVYTERFKDDLTIAFAFVSTHNHFVLDRGGTVFNRSAPVIKLPSSATAADHLELVGLLNSSAACFWMKQVFHCKGAQGVNEGGKSERWEQFYEFDSTKIRQFPVVGLLPAATTLTRRLDNDARAHAARETNAGLADVAAPAYAGTGERDAAQHQMIAAQEELDWQVYSAYGLLDGEDLLYGGDLPPVGRGQRAFEIALARRLAAGATSTAWFERHDCSPATSIPQDWPPAYREVVERRIAATGSNKTLRLLEQPEHKRRWLTEPWDKLVERNTRTWLLDRLEAPAYLPHADRENPPSEPPALVNTASLADRAARDPEFLAVAAVHAGRDDYDLVELVTRLALTEAVPALPLLRFKESGLRKRKVWEKVWALQRQQDAGETPEIPVPPKYGSGDFNNPVSWRMRGKLDVPKERFNLYPYAARPGERGAWVTWAGLDHLQRAQALAAAYLERRDHDGWTNQQLTPFLAELDQLVPWLKQWHNDPDPHFNNQRMGEFYAEFVLGEIHKQGLTVDEVRSWVPPKKTRRRKAR